MKKTTVLALAAMLFINVGCATTANVPERLDRFVDKTENEYRDYSSKDWSKSRETYQNLVDKMDANYSSYSAEKKIKAAAAMSRYNALLFQNEISGFSGSLGNLLEQLPEVINGTIDKIDTASLRKNIEEIKACTDTAKLRKSLETMIGKIDTAALRKKITAIAASVDTAELNKQSEAILKLLEKEFGPE